jgi:hypothetical protein
MRHFFRFKRRQKNKLGQLKNSLLIPYRKLSKIALHMHMYNEVYCSKPLNSVNPQNAREY